jgi:hypothetical protein
LTPALGLGRSLYTPEGAAAARDDGSLSETCSSSVAVAFLGFIIINGVDEVIFLFLSFSLMTERYPLFESKLEVCSDLNITCWNVRVNLPFEEKYNQR